MPIRRVITVCSMSGNYTNILRCSKVLFQTVEEIMVADNYESKNLSQVLSQYLAHLENRYFILKNGQYITTTIGSEKDVKVVTKLIHEAFSIWKSDGLDLGPMHQNIEQTKGHLVGKGLVFRDGEKKVVGTVSFDFAAIETVSDQHLFCVNNQSPIPYQKLSSVKLQDHRFLIIKRIATHPRIVRSGLGTSILHFAENLALTLKLDGVALETVKETQWLYRWYTKESYQTIGLYHYPSRPINTVLKIKMFNDENVE